MGYALATLPFLAYGWFRGAPGCAARRGRQPGRSSPATACWPGGAATPGGAFPRVLRLFYAPIVYVAFYRQVEILWPLFHARPWTGAWSGPDSGLFGCQPSLAFRAALPWRGLSELFCFAYLAYYFFTPVVGLTALFSAGYEAAERIILAVTATFLLFYALFWLFAHRGAPLLVPAPRRGRRPLRRLRLQPRACSSSPRGGEIRGGAFPSSHIAVAVLFTLWARREVRPLFPPLAAVTALMLPAVVYLRAHYLLDVPAGLAAGFLAYGISRRLIPSPPFKG